MARQLSRAAIFLLAAGLFGGNPAFAQQGLTGGKLLELTSIRFVNRFHDFTPPIPYLVIMGEVRNVTAFTLHRPLITYELVGHNGEIWQSPQCYRPEDSVFRSEYSVPLVGAGELPLPCGSVTMGRSMAAGAAASFTDRFPDAVHGVLHAAFRGPEWGISPTSAYFGPSGGTGVVRAASWICPWTASTGEPWITVLSGGQDPRGGYSRLTYAVAPNAGPPRVGTITIAGKTFTVTQGTDPAPPAPPEYQLYWHRPESGFSVWMMKGTELTIARGAGVPMSSDTNWRMVGASDFNADGSADLLWQHQMTGALVLWWMTGNAFRAATLVAPGASDVAWTIRAVGDMNGDGHVDLIWQHRREGWLAVWFMSGSTPIGASPLSPNRVPDTGWRIAGASDFNRDGPTDLLWQHDVTGRLAVWLMDGTAFRMPGFLSVSEVTDTNWKIAALADVDGQGSADFIWHHQTSGVLVAWLMDGLGLRAGRLLSPERVPDTSWQLVGPR